MISKAKFRDEGKIENFPLTHADAVPNIRATKNIRINIAHQVVIENLSRF